MSCENVNNQEREEGLLALRHLVSVSPEFRKISEKTGVLNVHSKDDTNIFFSLVRTVVGQMLSRSAARTIFSRLIDRLATGDILKPSDVQNSSIRILRECGLSKSKSTCIKEIADSVESGKIPELEKINGMSDEDIIKLLTKIKGVGRWTAEMIMIFELGRPDVMALGDIGVLRGYQKLKSGQRGRTLKSLQKISAKWKPYRSYAVLYLYRVTDEM